jgi:hypothetical protein
MRGGSYNSASTYGEYVNGPTGAQFSRVFDQAGAYGQVQGNIIIGAQGQNVQPASMMPSKTNLDLIQSAGRRRHRRGGFLGEVVNQAIVPFALVGMQNTYRRRKGGRSRRTRRRGRR